MSFSYPTKFSQGTLLSKATTHLKAVGYNVKTKGYILEASNGRDYSKNMVCIFFILGVIFSFVISVLVYIIAFAIGMIPLVIYWFTRKKNKITVDTTSEGNFTISYDGNKAITEAERLSNMLKEE